MDIIRKKICFEASRNRVGSSLPYYVYNVDDGGQKTDSTVENKYNYGNFTADFENPSASWLPKNIFVKNGEKNIVRSKEMMRRHAELLNILRHGTICGKRVDKVCVENGSGDGSYVRILSIPELKDDTCLGLMDSAVLYRKATPKRMSEYSVDSYGIYYGADGGDYINLLTDSEWESYENLGGIEFLKKFDGVLCDYKSLGGKPVPPYIEMQILLRTNTAEVGVLSEYNPSEYDLDSIQDIEYSNKNCKAYDYDEAPCLTPERLTGQSITVNSRLEDLSLERFVSDTDTLPGIFKPADGGNGTNGCTSSWNGKTWSKPSVGGNAAIRLTVNVYDDNLPSGTYMLQYFNNDSDYLMDFPYKTYKENVAFNLQFVNGSTFICDYISNIVEDGDTVEFEYVMGGMANITYSNRKISGITPINGYGVVYKEKYTFNIEEIDTMIDGYKTTVWCKKINFDDYKVNVYNYDYGLSRDGNIATITDMTVADVWKEGAINTPVFKEEYLLGQAFSYKTDINVEVDRGAAAAFEKHFKLRRMQ